jgi:hypothetical protein
VGPPTPRLSRPWSRSWLATLTSCAEQQAVLGRRQVLEVADHDAVAPGADLPGIGRMRPHRARSTDQFAEVGYELGNAGQTEGLALEASGGVSIRRVL